MKSYFIIALLLAAVVLACNQLETPPLQVPDQMTPL